KPVEEALNTINGINIMRSVTKEGVSTVIVEFVLERDGEVAAQDVRDKVATMLNKLPDGTDPPVVEKFDIDASPVISFAVSGRRNMQELTELADKRIKQDIESLRGVGQVLVVGGRKRAVNVYVDAGKMEAYGIPVTQVRRALAAQNVELPGGRVDQGSRELVLRTMGRMESAEQFGDIIVAERGGTPVYLKDIGRVENTVEEPRSLARLDGENAVTLVVRKQSGTNTVDVVDRVKARIGEVRPGLPPDIEIKAIKDTSRFIKRSINELKFHLVLGALLVCLVVFIFMRDWRSTVVVALSVPASLISTFTMMKLMGFTINNMTLLGLTLAVGVVIDDAIVVLENIFRHIEEKGETPMQAAMDATGEIALAVMATTLSLVVIFLPVAFMYGAVGRFFQSYGFTVATAILVSLVVAFTLIPSLAARFLKRKTEALPAGGRAARKSAKDSLLWRTIDGSYGKVLRWSLRHRLAIAALSLLVVVSTVPLIKVIGKDFLPLDDMSEFYVAVTTPEGYTLERSGAAFAEVESRLAKLRGVKTLLTTIGETEQAGVTRGQIYVGLVDLKERDFGQRDVMAEARVVMKDFPDLRSSVEPVALIGASGGKGADLVFNVHGPDLDRLGEYTTKIMDEMRKTPGFTDVDTTASNRKPELRVHVDREKASDLGVKVEDVAAALRTFVGGEKVTKYKEGADQYDVWLRAELSDRDDPAGLGRLSVPSDQGRLVPLSNLVVMREELGPAQIDRQERQRLITVVANMEQGYPLSYGVEKAKEIASKLDMPTEYRTSFLGWAKIMGETFSNFFVAFILSIVLMYIILASQFESFLHPVTIMLALPISIPFALLSLILLGETLNIYSIFGLFMLFGIVKKNGILQVDYTNTLIARGMERDAAILEANHTRLRPILMTTVTLIAGMIPIALGNGPGAASRASMAKVIIGGQALCLLLTLVVTPVAYSFFDDVQRGRAWATFRERWKARPRFRKPVEAGEPVE
ncbi:MAG TPA: efflux RND transporter permease subunit, partial [Nitrospirota bacterium]|nr:efflux RND transporter permease subunit [Nitrospirota bacterium]